MVDLFEDAAEAPDEQQLSINQSYAERYQHNKRRVHLEQLQQKYGEEEGDSDESDSEDVTEDEDGEQLTPQVDAAILRTLQRIREKGSDLYDADNRVFDIEQAQLRKGAPSARSSSSKKMTLQAYQRSRVLQARKNSRGPAQDIAEATTVT